jgi:hypothetical protein
VWEGVPIPIADVSSPIDDHEGVGCFICLDQPTAPGVRTPCSHAYCEACLEKWIHCCMEINHTCPYCRAQLLEIPKYNNKDPALVLDYLRQRAWYSRQLATLYQIHKSNEWFQAELAFQQYFENDIAGHFVQVCSMLDMETSADLFDPIPQSECYFKRHRHRLPISMAYALPFD